MSLWAVLLTGLFAGGASCAAVQGGLLAGTLARRHPERATVGAGTTEPTKRPAAPAPGLAADAAPVGAFLAGKLVSHALLGAALGLVGDAVQVGAQARAFMQITAGIVMVVLALDLLGVKFLRGIVPASPKAWSHLVRRSGRGGTNAAPALLGAATVLIPCGVTLSMMFLAVASGSPLAGAAIMATFVIGTAPLFAAIGYAARRSTNYLRGRLSLLAGVAVLITGLVAINGGLVLNGSSFSAASVWSNVTGATAAPPVAAPALDADGVQRIVIQARSSSYSPSNVTARAGVPTEITVRTNNTQGCTRFIVMSSFGVEQALPATGDTVIDVGKLDAGTHRYTCGMGMYSGSITAVA